MSVIAKAEVTISDILDGNSISEITNFYKVSSKSSGETAPQNSGGRNLVRGTSSEWSEWWTPDTILNSCVVLSYIFPGDIKIGDAFTTTIEIEVSKFAFTETEEGNMLWSQGSVDDSWSITNPFAKGLVRFTADELSKSFIKRFTKTSYVNNDNIANAKKFQFGFRCDYSDGTGKIRWRLLKAERGNRATDWTPAPEDLGWSTTVPTLTETNKYLWNYEMITGSDGQVISYTEPRVIGVYGDKGQTGNTGATGATGNGVKSITEYYQISTSNKTAPTSWLTTVPTLTATNKYLWNYEKITYTNETSVDTAKRVIGVYGDKGNTGATGPAGKGIKSTAITYQAGTSGTTAPTGTWNTSVPSVAQGQYLWSRTVITYTDNSTSTTYSVAYIPKNGQNGATGSTGATGTGVASIAQQYYLSTSKTTQTGGSWITSMPTWSSGKYLWTRYQITYKNPTSTSYTSPICDSSWEAVNEVQVGGRNYLKNSDVTYVMTNTSGEKMSGLSTTEALNIEDLFNYPFTLSFYVNTPGSHKTVGINSGTNNRFGMHATLTYKNSNGTTIYTYPFIFFNGNINKEGRVYHTEQLTRPSDAVSIVSISFAIQLSIAPADDNNEEWIFSRPKFELGNVATDWTPAPEDVQADIDEAAKTATNYMNFDNNGLVIGDLTKGTLGRNVLIDSDSVDIRNGTNTLATFSDNLIELGKGNTNSSIKLCDGAGTIDIDDSLTGYNLLKLKTKDDISGLTLQSTMVTIAQPSRSPTDSTATISVYGDLPAPGLDTTSSYIQLECRNGGGGSSFIGMYADKTNGVYDQSMSLKVWASNGGYSGIGITGTSVKINNGDLYDKYNKIYPNGVPVYGGGNGPDPNTTLDSLILSAHANAPGSGFKYIYTAFYDNKTTTSNRGQFAIPYGDSSNYVYYRFYYNGSWSVWFQLADQNDLNSAKSLAQRAVNWVGKKHNERLSIEWAKNSSGVWTMYFYIDGALVRTW